MSTFAVELDVHRRRIHTTLSGLFDEASIEAWAKEYEAATDRFRGHMHVVLADMRGLKTMRKEVADRFGAAIGYARAHGVVLCAHISDETVQRLQASRVARQNSEGDDVTVDVASLDEAKLVCAEALERIDDARPVSTVRIPA